MSWPYMYLSHVYLNTIYLKPIYLNLLLLFGLISLPAPAVAKELTTASVIAPKATTSLLLDISRVGESARLVAVGERGHILYSEDHGANWQQVIAPTRQMLTSVYFINNQKGVVAGHDAVILKTDDGGEHWQLVYQNPDSEAPILDLVFVDQHLGFAVGAYGTLLRTVDGGATWHNWKEHIENDDEFHFNAITLLGNGYLLIAGEAGILYRSEDQGQSWLALPSPYEGSLFSASPLSDQAAVMITGLNGHIFRSHDSGSSWQRVPVSSEHSFFTSKLFDNKRLIVAGNGGIWLQGNGRADYLTIAPETGRAVLTGVEKAGNGRLVFVGQGGVFLVGPENK